MATPTQCAARSESLSVIPRMWYTRVVKTTIEPSRKHERVDAPGWKRSFGKLKDIKAATREVQRVVDREFSRIDAVAWK